MSKRKMHCVSGTVTIVLFFLQNGMLRADGLIYQLPPDQTWVKYDLKVQFEGSENIVDLSFVLQSGGIIVRDGEKYRKIGFQIFNEKNSKKHRRLREKTIPEKDLAAGKDPFASLTNKIGTEQFSQYFRGPFESETALPPKIIETKLGKLECKGIRAIENVKNKKGEDSEVIYEIRLHEKSPFGVISFQEIKILTDSEGNPTKQILNLTLEDFGTGAYEG